MKLISPAFFKADEKGQQRRDDKQREHGWYGKSAQQDGAEPAVKFNAWSGLNDPV